MTDQMCMNDGAYVIGALAPAERLAFERHLAQCPACQAAVARLAGLPGLLSQVRAEFADGEPEIPPTVLPTLLGRVRSERRRRRIISYASIGLAAAAAIALIVVLIVRPAPATQAQPAAVVNMEPHGPMAVTVSMFDKQWGTSMTVNCRYEHEDGDEDWSYRLVVVDKRNIPHDAGSWATVAGNASTVTVATALHRSEISELQIKLANGQVILSAPI